MHRSHRRIVATACCILAPLLAAGCGDDGPTAPSPSSAIAAFEAAHAYAVQENDAGRWSAIDVAVSALRLGAPITRVTVTRDGRAERWWAVVARYSRTQPAYSEGGFSHQTELVAWRDRPGGELAWFHWADTAQATVTPEGFQSTENRGALLNYVSLMAGGTSRLSWGGPGDEAAAARATVAARDGRCAATGSAAEALAWTGGRIDCRPATFSLAGRARIVKSFFFVGDPDIDVDMSIDATNLPGVWFRVYCAALPCPPYLPGSVF